MKQLHVLDCDKVGRITVNLEKKSDSLEMLINFSKAPEGLGNEVLSFLEQIITPVLSDKVTTPIMQLWSIGDEPFVSWFVNGHGAVVMPLSEGGRDYLKSIAPRLKDMGVQPFEVEFK
jgi:hypothetical protein